jgi:hypothetical protein
VRLMTAFNDGAARPRSSRVSAATDVSISGRGPLGHVRGRAGGGAGLRSASDPVPRGTWLRGHPGGTQRNLDAAVKVTWAEDVDHDRILCADAQTRRAAGRPAGQSAACWRPREEGTGDGGHRAVVAGRRGSRRGGR